MGSGTISAVIVERSSGDDRRGGTPMNISRQSKFLGVMASFIADEAMSEMPTGEWLLDRWDVSLTSWFWEKG
jgi:hypothetical protein